MEIKQSNRGGVRVGAGRKKKEDGQRPQNQMRAYPEEWELIKAYAKITKNDPERAKRILETK